MRIFKSMKKAAISVSFVLFSLVLPSCGTRESTPSITVMLEDGEYRCANKIKTGRPGDDFYFDVSIDAGLTITGTSYTDYSIVADESYTGASHYERITFHAVRYSTLIVLDIEPVAKVLYVDEEETVSKDLRLSHLRHNSENDYSVFAREGYKLAGWLDSNDNLISLGSRFEAIADENIVLRPYWAKENRESDFEYRVVDDRRISITKYIGEDTDVVIPDRVGGRLVETIESGAFATKEIDSLILPEPLSRIDNEAFSSVSEMVVYDKLVEVSDLSFLKDKPARLRINAVTNPAYIRTYFGTFADKVDRIARLKEKDKIVLYGGSSTRFGFDSEIIDWANPKHEVVNMGVFAYTESLPQAEIIRPYLHEGDIVIISPEFDSIDKQIDADRRFDYATFCLCEANFDMLRNLPIASYEGVYDSFCEFQKVRRNLPRFSYSDSPNRYDEDGKLITTSSYNQYGDYSLYRENNLERKNFGVKRAFYNKAHFPSDSMDAFKRLCEVTFGEVSNVFYDYSPRMSTSLSEDSSKESIIELGEYLKSFLALSFLSDIQESLMDPLYFNGTDNHLSSEGAKTRSERVAKRLSALSL